MFGSNEPASRRQQKDTLLVREMFLTIQGEGPFTGRPAVFIRLAGCNLRCHFCDTDFDEAKSAEMTPEAIAARAETMALEQWGTTSHAMVVVTGGEPLLQNLGALFDALERRTVLPVIQVETSGSVPLPPGYENSLRVFTVVSPKTQKVHPSVQRAADAYKYVVGHQDPVTETGIPHNQPIQAQALPVDVPLPPPHVAVWLQPLAVYDGDNQFCPEATARNERHAAALAVEHGYHLSLQVHKHGGLD